MNYEQIREQALNEIANIIDDTALDIVNSSTKEISYNHGKLDGLMRAHSAVELTLLKIERDNRTN
jgi:hypothetical protein